MTRFDFTVDDWIVCRHYPGQTKTGRGPWTVAQVRAVHETKLMLSQSRQETTALRTDPKPYVLKTRVQNRFSERDDALRYMEWLKMKEALYVLRSVRLHVEFARQRAKLLSDHLGETT